MSQLEQISTRNKDMKMVEDQIQKEKESKKQYDAKFTEFSHKYDQKHNWFQENIIKPQMEKHIQDFEREVDYNENRQKREIKKEQDEIKQKKRREK